MNDKERAVYYAKRKIEQIEMLNSAIKAKYLNAFKRVLTLSYGQGVNPSYFQFSKHFRLNELTDSVINRLVRDLYRLIEDCAIRESELAMLKNESEEEVDIIAYINRPIDGRDINVRLADYGEKAKYEFEAFVAAGLLLNKPVNAVFNEFKASYTKPYSSTLIKEVIALKGAQIAANRLLTRGVSYGAGKYVATANSLIRLGEGTANFAYGFADEELMQKNGAIGYDVYRGSSYPCAACDDVVGFHPIGSYVLPVHPRCMCYAVPRYV